jgi:hypothetical protein
LCLANFLRRFATAGSRTLDLSGKAIVVCTKAAVSGYASPRRPIPSLLLGEIFSNMPAARKRLNSHYGKEKTR